MSKYFVLNKILIIAVLYLTHAGAADISMADFDHGVKAFDVGSSSDSVLWPGFTRLSEKCVYGKTGNFGWVDPSVITFIKRPYTDAAPISSNYAVGRGPFEFKIDIPDGNYVVIIFSGDIMYGGQQAAVMLNEKKELLKTDLGPNICLSIYKTTIIGSVFSLKILTGTINGFGKLNAIVIAPESVAESTIKKCETIAEEINLINSHVAGESADIWQKEQFNETIPEPNIANEQYGSGYIPFTRKYVERIFSTSRPRQSEILIPGISKLSVCAAAGESEPLIFAVKPLRDFDDVILGVSDLVGQGHSIRINMKHVRKWNQKIKGSWDTHFAELPELLESWPKENFSIVRNTCEQFWMTIDVPEDTQPGIYKGNLIFGVEKQKPAIFPIELTVYPFRLDCANIDFHVWYSGLLKSEKELTYDMQNIKLHGLTGIIIDAPADFTYDIKTGWHYDYSQIDKIVKNMQSAELKGAIPVQLGQLFERLSAEPFKLKLGSRQNTSQAIEIIRNMYLHAKSQKWPELLFYIADEPHNSAYQKKKVQELGRCVHQVQGARTFVTGIPDTLNDIREYIDVRCMTGQFLTANSVKEAISDGDEVWFYYNPPFIFENPAHARFIFGVYAWRIGELGVRSVGGYTYQSPNGSPYGDMDVRLKDWCAAYPSPNGPINTIQFEGVCEGIDDYRYLTTLMNAVITRAGDAAFIKAVNQANIFLESLRKQVPADFNYDLTGKGFYEFNNSPQSGWYDEVRENAARLICELKYESKTSN